MEKIGRWTKATAATTVAVLSIGVTSVASGVTMSTVGDSVSTATDPGALPSAKPMLAWAPMQTKVALSAGPATTLTLPPSLLQTIPNGTVPASELAALGAAAAQAAAAVNTTKPILPVAALPPGSAEIINPWRAPTMNLPDPSTAPELEIGDRGELVTVLERRLSELGYRPGDIDEYFSHSTWSAVLAFQKAENLERKGWMDAATWQRLAAPQAWRPSNSIAYPRVEVDLERQITLVVLGPQHLLTLNSSTGGGYEYRNQYGGWEVAETPTGTWNVYRTVEGYDVGPLGAMYRPMYFYQGYALHGSDYVPDYPDSHGCVRLSNDDMDWLRDLETEELQVTIYATMNPREFYPGSGRRGAPGLTPTAAPTPLLPL